MDFPIVGLLAASLRFWTPLSLAAMGGVVSERSGVVNIGLEGMMLGGAFGALAVAHSTNSPIAGALAGIGMGAAIGLLHAVLTQALRVPHILSGVALNLGVLGVTTYVYRLVGDASFQSAQSLPAEAMVIIALLVVGLLWFGLNKTALGLRLRACGENPKAARSSGVSVTRVRYGAVALSGALAGLGGVALALTGLGAFTENMTAGRGYIALAAVIFGRWNPVYAALAALLFSLGDALQLSLQTAGYASKVPSDFLTLLPYVITLLALLGLRGKAAAPAALGNTDA